MADKPDTETINIRPGVSILAILRHLNYRPWYALAEFVDNSIQSYIQHQSEIKWVENDEYKLKVSIDIDQSDGGRIVIRDNAAGIFQSEYKRAFRPAELPPDQSGLAEFGMGMKSAACWFAPRWMVRTTALGESVERSVTFDIGKIVRDEIEELSVVTRPARPIDHFTQIVLYDLYKCPQTKTIAKIREHLASIYRVFIRDGTLALFLNEEPLEYPQWAILNKPFFKTPDADSKEWRKEIDFDFGGGLKAHGFAALFETAHISSAGFALFRRNRLIQGSADEGYRPEKIFGTPNKFTYQRLFGELHLEGFEVSHTKDGFKWDENEETFLDILKEHLNAEPLPLLDQAEGYRVRVKQDLLQKGAEVAIRRTAEVIQREVPAVVKKQIQLKPEVRDLPNRLVKAEKLAAQREIEFHGMLWRVIIELSNDPAIGEWVSISDVLIADERTDRRDDTRQIVVRLSMAHPFMERFSDAEPETIEPLLRVGVAICLAEVTARESGAKMAGTVRRNINELLRDALSKP